MSYTLPERWFDAPEAIYLDVCDTGSIDEPDCGHGFKWHKHDGAEITWSEDDPLGNKLKYIRADIVAARIAELEQKLADLQSRVDRESRPDILEKLTYHALERDDLTLQDCIEFLSNGWKNLHGRTERQFVLQLTELLASPPNKGEPQMEIETRTYSDGTVATGPAPLPLQSPAQQDAAQQEQK